MSVSGTASATLITINQTDGGGGTGAAVAGELAGLNPGAFIETFRQGATSLNGSNASDLRDETGSFTGVSIAASAGWGTGSFQNPTTGFDAGAGNQSNVMMENYTDTASGSLTFSGLSTWLASQGHDAFNLIVYTARNSVFNGQYSAGSETKYVVSSTSYTGPFAEGGYATRIGFRVSPGGIPALGKRTLPTPPPPS